MATPAVVLSAGRVQVATASARAQGIRAGMRRRDAQSRCPDLAVLGADPDRDARLFEPVAAAVDDIAPGIEVLRPGMVACAARGPAGYFGSESAAAEKLLDVVEALDVECHAGIADGLSVAVLAARHLVIVPPGGDADFCARLPIIELARDPAIAPPQWGELAGSLRRLGMTTAGAFAALPVDKVAARFGADGLAMYRLASGATDRGLSRRGHDVDLTAHHTCDPPLERVDTAAFIARRLAERFHDLLAANGAACTRLEVSVVTEHGRTLSRIWRCSRPLTPSSTADRLRWQLDGWLRGRADRGGGMGARRPRSVGKAEEGVALDRAATDENAADRDAGGREPADSLSARPLTRAEIGAVTELRLTAIDAVDAGRIQYGLWGPGGGGEDRAESVFARVQGLLGPDAVLSAVVSGGRRPAERVGMAAWGEQNAPGRDPTAPWPGAVPSPAPARTAAIPAPRQPASRQAALRRHPDLQHPDLQHPDLQHPDLQHPALQHPALQQPALPPEGAQPVAVCDRSGAEVAVTDRGLLTGVPDVVQEHRVLSWAGPWLVDERWWAGPVAAPPRRRARMQIVTDTGPPMLLEFGSGGWRLEAVYD